MKITPQMLSLPPYISTTWANIASLRVTQNTPGGPSVLIIELLQGNQVEVPGLDPATIDLIFLAHESALESAPRSTAISTKQDPLSLALNLPFKMFGDGLNKMGAVLQHNPEAADTPDLPKDVVEKIAFFVRNLGLSESTAIPMAEESCNCTFCQVARTIHNAIEPQREESPSSEEAVSDEDLRFRTWDIMQKGDRLYLVTNPIDETEQYNVFLGEPLGCTCGHRDCEHIRAVLKT